MNQQISKPESHIEPSIGEQQVAVAEGWAKAYADPELELPASAEIALRNPLVYIRDEAGTRSLPETLKDRWGGLLDLSDALATVATTREHAWSPGVSGLEKIQTIVNTGDVNPAFRRSIADIMVAAAGLFAESTTIVPGNTNYYKGNIQGAESWLAQHPKSV